MNVLQINLKDGETVEHSVSSVLEASVSVVVLLLFFVVPMVFGK